MADFVAVIRKAVDGLADNTLENRERVYEKARRAVRRQLENMTPPPSEEIVNRQLDKLDAAIQDVELEHVEALPADDGDYGALSFDEPEETPVRGSPPEEVETPSDEAPSGAESEPAAPPADDRQSESPSEAEEDDTAGPAAIAGTRPETGPADAGPADTAAIDTGPVDRGPTYDDAPAGARETDESAISPFDDDDRAFGRPDEAMAGAPAGRASRRRRTPLRPLVLALVGLLVVAGAAYGLWSNRASIEPMIASLTGSSASKAPSEESQTESADTQPSTSDSGTAAEFPANEPGAASNDTDTAASGEAARPGGEAAAGAGLPDGGKYTQRLLPDGSETDPGPAPEPDQPQSDEGSSVSAQTAENVEPARGSDSSGTQDEPSATATAAGEQAAISQKMYLYEQRFKDQKTATTTTGSVVWSLAKDTSDGDGTATTVIHGEISVPEKGLTALMTIKPNTDPSLPASHLIELVFALPGDFSGGGIASVERVALKQTEQDRGDALVGVPAKITDNFFMVALNDYAQAVKSNVELLQSRNWIDIPITYTNGRRALITLEKGSSGTDTFEKAFAAWDEEKTESAGPSSQGTSGTGPNGPGDDAGGTPEAPATRDSTTPGGTPGQ